MGPQLLRDRQREPNPLERNDALTVFQREDRDLATLLEGRGHQRSHRFPARQIACPFTPPHRWLADRVRPTVSL